MNYTMRQKREQFQKNKMGMYRPRRYKYQRMVYPDPGWQHAHLSCYKCDGFCSVYNPDLVYNEFTGEYVYETYQKCPVCNGLGHTKKKYYCR